jgi:hypothetical protein
VKENIECSRIFYLLKLKIKNKLIIPQTCVEAAQCPGTMVLKFE